jgi:nitrite reductase/ring-hydroxylating ferredoxin subunit
MDRRSFISLASAGMAAVWAAIGVSTAAMVRFLVPNVFYEPPQSFKIGNPGDFPFGAPTFMPDQKIFVFRDKDKGFTVASAVCTHLGCTVNYSNDAKHFVCPCHGSVFSPDGNVTHGPAPRSLDWLEVTLARDGQLQVDKGKVVGSTYRLLV